jgi:hypothetical protein
LPQVGNSPLGVALHDFAPAPRASRRA